MIVFGSLTATVEKKKNKTKQNNLISLCIPSWLFKKKFNKNQMT